VRWIAVFAWLVSIEAIAHAAVPHRSTGYLPSSNGKAAIAYDAKAYKLVQLLEHPYRSPSQGILSRDFLYDAYPGIRVGTQGTWLNSIAPALIEYVPKTGIVHVLRTWSGLSIDEYDFAPMSLGENAAFTIVKVTRTSGSGAIDAYQIMNYHLGSGSPEAGASAEGMSYAASRDAYYEWGPSGVAMGHASIAASTHHGASPNNPYNRLLGGLDLADDPGPGSPYDDAVCGFQQSLGDLQTNQSAFAGWFSVLALDANAQPAVDRVRTWINGRAPDAILQDEIDGWTKWVPSAPMGSSQREADLWATSHAMLRMGQVSESGAPDGQILASIAPGKWNIAWVRDMAYATNALARTGHVDEAKRALAFQMKGMAGSYQQYVGAPYQISVVRYFGNGNEESDSDQNGPNIEFDGFGLFLWALDAYIKASNDTTSLQAWWPVVTTKIADVLVGLEDAQTGLIAADSSIWEVHWNGKQQQFAYTSIAAAAGLCAASRLAKAAGDSAKEQAYLTAGRKVRDGIFAHLRAADGTLASSLELLGKGTGFLDAAAIEAVTLGIVQPQGHTARATTNAITQALVPPSGRGFFRNQNGGWYDLQEWVFVDLRVQRALELTGNSALQASTFGWNVDQATENFGILSELHDATTADYAGEAPMVGFGAGAYVLGLLDRGAMMIPACGDYNEPPEIIDAGVDGSMPANDASVSEDSGSDAGVNPPPPMPSGCSCNQSSGPSALASPIALALLFLLRRRR
jgi:MYXO-CTERM domain-containing protein